MESDISSSYSVNTLDLDVSFVKLTLSSRWLAHGESIPLLPSLKILTHESLRKFDTWNFASVGRTVSFGLEAMDSNLQEHP